MATEPRAVTVRARMMRTTESAARAIRGLDVDALVDSLRDLNMAHVGPVLSHAASSVVYETIARPQRIDSLVSLLFAAAPRLQALHPDTFHEGRERDYFVAPRSQTSGAGTALLLEVVAEAHSMLLAQAQRSGSPRPRGDARLGGGYYHRALCASLLLARLFVRSVHCGSADEIVAPAQASGRGSGHDDSNHLAYGYSSGSSSITTATTPPQGVRTATNDSLGEGYMATLAAEVSRATWLGIQDVLVRAIFSPTHASQGSPSPGALLAAAVLLRAAPASLATYLAPQGRVRGRGRFFVWFDDRALQPSAEWGWPEVLEAATGGVDGVLEAELAPAPELLDAFDDAARHAAGIRRHGADTQPSMDEDVETVLSHFTWIQSLAATPSAGRGADATPIASWQPETLARAASLEQDLARRLRQLAGVAEGVRFGRATSGDHGDPHDLERATALLQQLEDVVQGLRPPD